MFKNLVKRKQNKNRDAYSVALFTSMTREGTNAFSNNQYSTGVTGNAENAYSNIENNQAGVWPGVTGYPKVTNFSL